MPLRLPEILYATMKDLTPYVHCPVQELFFLAVYGDIIILVKLFTHGCNG
jgi:hypothetical protein